MQQELDVVKNEIENVTAAINKLQAARAAAHAAIDSNVTAFVQKIAADVAGVVEEPK